jgi:surfeit locus 1 family protein
MSRHGNSRDAQDGAAERPRGQPYRHRWAGGRRYPARVYRFAVRPRWILSHLFALTVVGTCVIAGLWQLDRLQERRDVNERQAARSELPVVAVTDLLGPGDTEEAVDEVALRNVEVVGTFRVDDQVTVANRTYDGAPGYWVLTPLVTADGVGVVVNRGWVPLQVGEGERVVEAAPPDGEVRVVGSLTASQERGSFGAVDASDGRLDRLARADIGRFAAQVDYPVLPAYVTLAVQVPAQVGGLPVVVEPVELGEGPHLGYAFQWFTFATIAALGYPLVLRKVARERAIDHTGERPRRRRSSAVPVDD